MIIAVTYENGKVFQHFGKSEAFELYSVENGQITNTRLLSSNGQGHGALTDLLSEAGVSVLICGGIGAGAQNALKEKNIQIFGGVSGSAKQAAEDYVAGRLVFDPNIQCNHHHEGEHTCSDHNSCSH